MGSYAVNKQNKDNDEGGFQSERLLSERLNRLWEDKSPDFLSEPSQVKGRLVGRYEIERKIGSGGFGIVYLARDHELDRNVALKIPRPEVLLDSDKQQRFRNEAELASRLEHDGIIKLYDASLDNSFPFIVSEYCPGDNLAQWLRAQTTPPSWKEAVSFVIKICSAVQYAHQQGVTHRDLKPANIMLVSSNDQNSFGDSGQQSTLALKLSRLTPKITDFGLGKLTNGSFADTRSSVLVGSPLYMAPEKIDASLPRDQPSGPDIYSIGVILFELLTLSAPFDSETYFETIRQVKEEPAPKLRHLNSDIPNALEQICLRCLEKNQNLRFPSVAAMGKALQHCLNGEWTGRRNWLLGRRFTNYMTHKNRISDAGKFVIGSNISMMIWMNGVWLFFSQMQELNPILGRRSGMLETVLSLAAVNLCLSWPTIWLAWKIIQRKRWAAIATLVSVVSTLPAIVMGCLNRPVFFESVYIGRPVFALLLHFFILAIYLVQIFLLVGAILALQRTQRTRKSNSSKS